MNVKRRILDLIEKQSMWVPYEGDYGGSGWMNVQTGEIRYQEERPTEQGEAEEPEPEAYGPYEGEQEPGEIVEEVDDYGPVDMDRIEEGDPVIFEDATGNPVAAEVEMFGEDGVGVDMGEFGYEEVDEEEILGAPAQDPPDGPAEGWAEAPEDISHDTYEEGQLIEVYDAEAGEYVMMEVDFLTAGAMDARVVETEDWAPGEDSEYEVGDVVTVNDQLEGDRFITAAEDTDYVDVDLGQPILDEESLKQEDEVWVDHGALTDGPVKGNVTVDEYDRLAVEFEDEDGQGRNFIPELHGFDHEQIDVYEQTADYLDQEEFSDKFLMSTNFGGYDLLDGHTMQVDHPTLGEVEGEVETHIDDEGKLWLSVVEYDEPEVGDWVEFDHPNYDTTVEGEVAEFDGNTYVMDTDPDEDGIGLLEVDPEAVETSVDTEASVVLNSEHPFSLLDTDHAVEDPTQTVFDADDLKVGDYVEVDDDIREVAAVGPDGDIRVDGVGWVTESDIEGTEGLVQEPLEPPETAPDDEWEAMPASASHGLAQGDWVYYHDDDSNSMAYGEVEETPSDEEVVVDGEEIHRDDMQGYVSSLPDNAADPYHMNEGDYIEYMDRDRETHEGIVTSTGGHGSDTYLEVIDEDGNTETIKPNQGSHAVTEYDDDYQGTLGAATPAIELDEEGNVVDERPTEEVVADLTENIDFEDRDVENRLTKALHLSKQQKKKLKDNLYTHFGVAPVEQFYQMKSAWKSQSGSRPMAETLERAYKEALDLHSDHRDNGGRAPRPEEVKLAETVATLSQDYFREVYGESTMLQRGSSNTAWESFVDEFLAEPHRDEYNLQFLTKNNHSTNKYTADKWNAFTAQHEVEADDVLSMTDFLFETGYEGETEVGVAGDDQTMSADGVYPGHTGERDVPMKSNIDEWGDDLTHNFFASLANSNGTFDYDRLSTGQMENLKRIVEKSYEHDVDSMGNSAVQNELEKARQTLREEGFEFEWEADSGYDLDDFRGIGEVTGFEPGQGVPVEFWNEFENTTMDGEVMGVDDNGGLFVWDDTGAEHVVSPDDLTFVDEVDLNNIKDEMERISPDEMVGEMSTDYESLEPLDEVYYAFSQNSDNVQEGTITDVGDEYVEISGEMGQSETFHRDEVEDGHVIPQDYESADGSDEFMDVDDFEDGMRVAYDTGITEVEGEVQYTTDDWVYVEDDSGEVHTAHPDDIEVLDDPAEGSSGPAVTVGDTVEVPVPDNMDYEGGPVEAEVQEVEPDGSVTIDYDALPWLPEDSDFDVVTADPGDYNITDEQMNDEIDEVVEDVLGDISGGEDGGEDEESSGGSGISFEEGEEVHLDNGYPEGHPDAVNETGTLGAPLDHDGGTIFPVLDDNGLVINEYTPQELSQLAEPADGTENLPSPEEVDPDSLSDGEKFQMETMGGVEDFVVMEAPTAPGEPAEVEDEEYGDRFLLWPDGELEQV